MGDCELGVPEIDREIAHLRKRQARRVMRLIGPLLDAWDQLPNDVKSECEYLGDAIDAIESAMEDE